jgi:hypothetical protein
VATTPAAAAAGTALAATHVARRIVGRLGEGSDPFSRRVGFERWPGPRPDAGDNGLQVGNVRVASASHSVAPAVIWRKADRSSLPPDRPAANTGAATTAGTSDLLQRARQQFSRTATAPVGPSSGPGLVSPTVEFSRAAPVRPPDPHHPQPGDPTIIWRRFAGPAEAAPPGGPPMDSPLVSADQSPAVFNAETIEWIIEAVEQRVLEELERRGQRYNPGVF